MMKISPFLEKKFFEYLDQRIVKGTEVVQYELLLKSSDLLIQLSEIMDSKYECLFYLSSESGRRKVFLIAGKNYLPLLLIVLSEFSGAAFHAQNGSITINIDNDEDSDDIYLRMSASGNCIDIIKEFAANNGGVFY